MSKGILSIIYKFNLFLIARKMSIHFTNPPESTVQSFSGSVGLSPQDVIISHLYRVIYFILIQNTFISFTLYNFKHFYFFLCLFITALIQEEPIYRTYLLHFIRENIFLLVKRKCKINFSSQVFFPKPNKLGNFSFFNFFKKIFLKFYTYLPIAPVYCITFIKIFFFLLNKNTK